MLCSVEMTQAFISNETNIDLALLLVNNQHICYKCQNYQGFKVRQHLAGAVSRNSRFSAI